MLGRAVRPTVWLLPFSVRFSLRLSQHRTLIAAPTSKSGPLTQRRSDRELPPIVSSARLWLRTLPIFIVVMIVSALGIFNYQKASSSIVNATMYALRTSEIGRKELGDEIYFRDRFPWIWGEMNQLHGRIDISFGVKGSKATGLMRFRSIRRSRKGYFETQEWSLETEDGRLLQLLDQESGVDPVNKRVT